MTKQNSHPETLTSAPATFVRDLALDPDMATAQILSSLDGGKALPEYVFKFLADKNKALVHAPKEEIADSLTRQSVILEGLFLRFAKQAIEARKADHAAALTKASLNCQRALNAVLATLHTLHEAERDAEAVEG